MKKITFLLTLLFWGCFFLAAQQEEDKLKSELTTIKSEMQDLKKSDARKNNRMSSTRETGETEMKKLNDRINDLEAALKTANDSVLAVKTMAMQREENASRERASIMGSVETQFTWMLVGFGVLLLLGLALFIANRRYAREKCLTVEARLANHEESAELENKKLNKKVDDEISGLRNEMKSHA